MHQNRPWITCSHFNTRASLKKLWQTQTCLQYTAAAICSVKSWDKKSKALNETPSQSCGISLAILDHTVLPATLHKWRQSALTPARQASTRFTYPGGTEGWVDLGGWILRWFTSDYRKMFLQRVSIACYAERCISYSKSVRPSVRLSVRHTLALSQNDSSYDHGDFTGG